MAGWCSGEGADPRSRGDRPADAGGRGVAPVRARLAGRAGHLRRHVEVDARPGARGGAGVEPLGPQGAVRRGAAQPGRGCSSARSARRSCFGAIGEALVGYTGRFQSFMHLQPNCPEGTLTMTAAHEFGHVLGLKHENKRCSLMNSVFVSRCRPQPLEWEWYCSPPRDDDRRGLLRRYGGKFRKSSLSFCVSKTLPGPGCGAGRRDRPGRLAGARPHLVPDTVVDVAAPRDRDAPARAGLRRHADLPQRADHQREGVTPRLGTLVAEVPKAARSAVVAVEDLAVSGTGTWCYAVFTLDRRNRWRMRRAAHRHARRREAAREAARAGGDAGGADRRDAAVDEPAHAARRRAGRARRRAVPGRRDAAAGVRRRAEGAGRGGVHRRRQRVRARGATACGSRPCSPARGRSRRSCRSPGPE